MRPSLSRLAALGILLLSLPALCASYQRAPKREEMLLNDRVVVVDYHTSATSEDLLLPFYAGARVENSYSYTVTTKERAPVLYYACAELVTRDAAERVADDYRGKLPGQPKPETISDEAGKRLVLAVATATEVRMVTITKGDGSSHIQLIRSTKPVIPEAPPQKATPRPPMRGGPGRGPGRGLRRGMRA